MIMEAQFIIAVSSSLTTAALLWLVRQVVKFRKTVRTLAYEHKFLMSSMQLVLTRLEMDTPLRDGKDKM